MWPDAFSLPWALLALAMPLALLAWRLARRRPEGAVTVHASDLFGPLPDTWRARLRWLPHALRLLALGCAIVALAGPMSWRVWRGSHGGADVMLLIDVSGSMQALDFPPDRLGAAKAFAERLVARRPADRIGLMTFASRTALRAPLTRDHAAVVAAVRELAPGEELLGDGTALGAAVVSAVERLARGRAGDRMLVLLSDGHGVRESVAPVEAAALAASRQVRVVTIGIGSGGAVPYPTEFGRVDVVLPLDAVTLRAVADRTRGRYVAAPDEPALRAVSDAIEEMESPAPTEVSRPELFSVARPWVLAAIALVLVETWLAGTVLRRHPE